MKDFLDALLWPFRVLRDLYREHEAEKAWLIDKGVCWSCQGDDGADGAARGLCERCHLDTIA